MNQTQEITTLENKLNQVKAEMQLRIIDLNQRLEYVKEQNRQLKLSSPQINIINEKIKKEARKWKRNMLQTLDNAIERDRINTEMIREKEEQIERLKTDHSEMAEWVNETQEEVVKLKDRYLAQVKINEMIARLTVNGNREKLTSLPPPYIGHNDFTDV